MEATTTLADALLDDLDDLSDVEETPREENEQKSDENSSATTGEPSADEESAVNSKPKPSTLALRFLDNSSLQKHLMTVRTEDSSAGKHHSIETQKEREAKNHQLVVASNKHLTNLADELARVHGDLATAYKPKFPELEELLPNPVQYKNAVRIIWNELDLTKVNDELNDILNSNQVITISVSGSTTSGRPLTQDELQTVDAAASYMDLLLEVQQELVQFVENSMQALAPSTCALIGSSTAARLLGLAGGLAELTKIPACNLQVLGQIKQNSTSRAGLSSASTKKHVGILAECELVTTCPKQLQKKALKAVASKLALCARCDFVSVDTGRPRSAVAGRQYRQELVEKFQKLQEPDKAQTLKALPK
jgi:U4/U6 small nuclear ribonucleoprotein PRP31